VNSSDLNIIAGKIGDVYGDPGYTVVADINLDGAVDSTDSAIQATQSGHSLGRSNLSRNPSLAGGVGSRMGYAGYAWEPSASRYHVRHRVLDPVRGRWSKRDPLGYVDSPTMYAYVDNRAMAAIDPSGLRSIQPVEPPADQREAGVRPVCPELQEMSQEPGPNGCQSGGGSKVECFSSTVCGPWLVDPYDPDNDGCGKVVSVDPYVIYRWQCHGPCNVSLRTTWVEKQLCSTLTICTDGRTTRTNHEDKRLGHYTYSAPGIWVDYINHCECHYTNNGLCPDGVVVLTPYPQYQPGYTPATTPVGPIPVY
jgi:RHS repeat-associated protein